MSAGVVALAYRSPHLEAGAARSALNSQPSNGKALTIRATKGCASAMRRIV
jgi:hypothetical protein